MTEEEILEEMEEDIERSFPCDMLRHLDVAAPWAATVTQTVCEHCGAGWNYLMCLIHTAVLRRDAERGLGVPCGSCGQMMPTADIKVSFL